MIPHDSVVNTHEQIQQHHIWRGRSLPFQALDEELNAEESREMTGGPAIQELNHIPKLTVESNVLGICQILMHQCMRYNSDHLQTCQSGHSWQRHARCLWGGLPQHVCQLLSTHVLEKRKQLQTSQHLFGVLPSYALGRHKHQEVARGELLPSEDTCTRVVFLFVN